MARTPALWLIAVSIAVLVPRAAAESKAFWKWAPTPPMGWNSYDAFGDSVTEDEVMANALWMRDHLLAHGYAYVVIDFRWYDPGAHSSGLDDRAGAKLAADSHGRLLPAENRFASAAGGVGFKPLADRLHAMGLKFGIHVMRGIPRQTVGANLPIEGSHYRAAEAADTDSTCPWCPDMFGVKGATPAGQAWYNSILRLYAQWGVDYVKVDDLSEPYSAAEIAAIRKAIDACGRPIVFSLSPGPTPLGRAQEVGQYANLWRISGDFWDQWEKLDRQFDLLGGWLHDRGPGHWPDADMIPLGHIAIRCHGGGSDHRTHFTPDEQKTLMTLWSLESSPLMLGMNLPDNDAGTESLIANDEVLAVDQDRLGKGGVPVYQFDGVDIWVKELADGGKAIGVFDRIAEARTVRVTWRDVGLEGAQKVRDLWKGADVGVMTGEMRVSLQSHGAAMFRVRAAGAK